MNKKILHLCKDNIFIPPFIHFVEKEFSIEEHDFLITVRKDYTNVKEQKNTHLLRGINTLDKLRGFYKTIIEMNKADKVILHSLSNTPQLLMLFFMPWVLKKCYWVIWGSDLYIYQIGKRNLKWKLRELLRRPVIRNIGNLVTYIEGDVDLAREWYGAKGRYHECLMYSSNVYKKYKVIRKQNNTINIQVGNSADISNNHIEVLEKLLPYSDKDICIFVPLSYGSEKYAQQVIEQGEKWFGSKFQPITKTMPFDSYLEFLSSIDIAIFNHKRQQAMGNIITLLGLGKKVYIRSDTTQWQFFKRKNILVEDIEQFHSLNTETDKDNIDIVKSYFSYDNYRQQLGRLF